jgi:hypothetical protein
VLHTFSWNARGAQKLFGPRQGSSCVNQGRRKKRVDEQACMRESEPDHLRCAPLHIDARLSRVSTHGRDCAEDRQALSS